MLAFISLFIAFFALTTQFAMAQSAGDALSLDSAKLTLNQEFKNVPSWRPGGVQVNASPEPLTSSSFSWAAGYIWDHAPSGASAPWPPPTHNFPAWTSNGAAEASPNGDMIEKLAPSLSPFSFSDGLVFTVRKMPDTLANTVGKSDPHDYIGATINSFPYSQKYGLFAISAKMPATKGVWPAFWLLPVDKTWPPELDVVEIIGKEPKTVYTTVHTNIPQKETAHANGYKSPVDLSSSFHEYAVDWGPDTINWYFDRKLVYSQPTPADLKKPCYILANVAVGSSKNWGGAPDSSSIFPASMDVAYIKVWQRDAYENSDD